MSQRDADRQPVSAYSLDGLSDLAQLGRLRGFVPGAVIITQGDESHSMYIILRGRVRVEREHADLVNPIVLAELGPGETVGEMGVLEHARRSATVIAIEETEVVEIDQEGLRDVLISSPGVATALLRTLSRRLRAADEEMERRTPRSPTLSLDPPEQSVLPPTL